MRDFFFKAILGTIILILLTILVLAFAHLHQTSRLQKVSQISIPTLDGGVPPVSTPETLDFWRYRADWETTRRTMTSLKFKRWIEAQIGTPVFLSGHVRDVDGHVTLKTCVVTVQRPSSNFPIWLADFKAVNTPCSQAEQLSTGDSILILCKIDGRDFLYKPSLGFCEIQ